MTTTTTTPTPGKVWLITGTTTGIGHSTVKYILSQSTPSNPHHVIAASRNITTPNLLELKSLGAHLLQLDQNQSQEVVSERIDEALGYYGRIDVVILNAANVVFGTVEERSHEETLAQFETNVFGPLKITRAVLPSMRERRSGTIVNIGSIAAVAEIAGTGIYNATKAAVRALSFALYNEVKPFGITSLLVEPGWFRTSFLAKDDDENNITKDSTSAPPRAAAGWPVPRIKDYESTNRELVEFYRGRDGKQLGDPEKAAKVLFELVGGVGQGEELPKWLVMGSDAVEWAREVYGDYEAQMKKNEEWSGKTDGDW